MGESAMRLQSQLRVPIVYRSHNVEHTYFRRQAQAASRPRDKITLLLASVGLRRYQRRLMDAAHVVFDISLDDMEYWTGLGVTNIHWLPPIAELALTEPPDERVTTDALFVGGLRTPNNVQGVRWLVHKVLPIVRKQKPDFVLGVVGAYPEPDLVTELLAVPNVVTYFDVPDVTPYQFGARVLVNPVAVGSGVQLKMLDMLMTDAPIVTRSQGLSGLPQSFRDCFNIADDESGFATAILQCLEGAGKGSEGRDTLRDQLGLKAVRDALSKVGAAEDPDTTS